MSERFRPSEPEDASKAIARRADVVDRALDASSKPVTRFSGRLSAWFTGLMVAVAGGAPTESHAEKIDPATAQAQLEKEADAHNFSFDKEEEDAEKKAAIENKQRYAELLTMSKNPQFDKKTLLGAVTVLVDGEGTNERVQNAVGNLSALLNNQPVVFKQSVVYATSRSPNGKDSLRQIATYQYIPVSVSAEAKAVVLPTRIVLDATDPRLPELSSSMAVKISSDLVNFFIDRSSKADVTPDEGRLCAQERDISAVKDLNEKEKDAPHSIRSSVFQTSKVSFSLGEENGKHVLIVTRYDEPIKTSVASAGK